MTRTVEEQLSALLDGELPPEEEELLLRRLETSAEYRATLARYGLVGEILRGSAPSDRRLVLGDRVRDAVAREGGHHAAPAAGGPRVGVAAAGLAAAAALVALVGIGQLQPRNGPGPVPVAATLTPIPQASVRLPPQAAIAPGRLTGYLVSHGEYSSSLSRTVVDSHIVHQTPELIATSYPARYGQ